MKHAHDILRTRLLQRAGLEKLTRAPYHGVSYEELRQKECSDGFCEKMDNRIVMGHLRYGPAQTKKPLAHDLQRARICLATYALTGNTELLVDATNWRRPEP